MNKIWVLTGIIVCGVLVLSAWLFIGDFGGFAKYLGEKSKNIISDEKIRFIGTWETTYNESTSVGYNGIYRFSSDGACSVGGLTGTWNIKDEKLEIVYYEGTAILSYDYFFFDDDDKLILIDADSGETLVFTKH